MVGEIEVEILPETIVYGPMRLFAKWVIKSFVVRFVFNDGVHDPLDITMDFGKRLTED